jgi:hypothetical protein
MTTERVLLNEEFKIAHGDRITRTYKPQSDWSDNLQQLCELLSNDIHDGDFEIWYGVNDDVTIKLQNNVHQDIVEASHTIYMVLPIKEDNDEKGLNQPAVDESDKSPHDRSQYPTYSELNDKLTFCATITWGVINPNIITEYYNNPKGYYVWIQQKSEVELYNNQKDAKCIPMRSFTLDYLLDNIDQIYRMVYEPRSKDYEPSKDVDKFVSPLMQHQLDEVFDVVYEYNSSDISVDDLRNLCIGQVVFGYVENVEIYHHLDIEYRHEISDGTLHRFSKFVVVAFKQQEAEGDEAVKDTNVNTQHAKDSMAIYEMQLHEVISIGDAVVKRVPGGWIYSIPVSDSLDQAVFVPFNNKFQDVPK